VHVTFSPGTRAACLASLVTLAAACGGSAPPPPASCGADDPQAAIDVRGRYHYASSQGYALRGTITFEQIDRLVRVTETTYENADDRPLMGEATLAGNRLDITLRPTNGDTDYQAMVGFRFDHPASATFCVTGFVDTNGDHGGARSYEGERL
jgi:hypothetical protein